MIVISREQKLKIISEILESADFRDSKRYQELLKYLFDEYEQGNSPKEITLGIQFFGKGNDFDPKEDTTVRVYMNTLRKKLEHYYLTNTPASGFKLIIPKGHYILEFVPFISPPAEATPFRFNEVLSKYINSRYLIIAGFLGSFLLGIFATRYFFGGKSPVYQPHTKVWNDFLAPNARPTLVLLGDFYFLFERNPDGNSGRFVREMNINSAEDYKARTRIDPEFVKKYVQSDFTYLRPSSSWGLASILPMLHESGTPYSLKLASHFSIDDAKSHNIIFIGSFKNLHSFQKILHIFNLDYKFSPATLFLHSGDSLLSFLPKEIKAGSYEKDYSVIAKAKGPDGSIILLLMGFADTGVIEATRFVTDAKACEGLFSDADGNSDAFTAVIETEGINQSIVKAHIQYVSGRGKTRAPETRPADSVSP